MICLDTLSFLLAVQVGANATTKIFQNSDSLVDNITPQILNDIEIFLHSILM